MTRNQLAIVQSLFVIGILLLLLGVATCVQKYVGVGSVFGVLGVIAVLAASAMWLRLHKADNADSSGAAGDGEAVESARMPTES
ncbi:hypothetical protein OHB26_25055 [Nocardia sp. NBC_01503]|uniref:hypothetical protein n=1 Tax=Nocardia sp. NBC_01503 TaxID=2975997 RepID=UPI002E7BADC6|nr:hypothetical protein [Nocardia sp. NBC_01503]WTL30203.1 hypothetical protein OHB26_25055 [Nocardia sp. NBC_01503]